MKTLKELIKEEREAVATMIAMRENYITAQNNLDAATRNLSYARIALDMALESADEPNERIRPPSVAALDEDGSGGSCGIHGEDC